MLRKNKSRDETLDAEPFQTLVGKNTAIEGRLTFSEGIRIDGRVNGDVELAAGAEGAVAVGPDAEVRGNISAQRVLVAGKVVGDIQASDAVHLLATARISGDVSYGRICISPGAQVNGTLTALAEARAPTAAKAQELAGTPEHGTPVAAGLLAGGA